MGPQEDKVLITMRPFQQRMLAYWYVNRLFTVIDQRVLPNASECDSRLGSSRLIMDFGTRSDPALWVCLHVWTSTTISTR